MQTYPYFLYPEQHQLATKQKTPNTLVVTAMLILLVFNEFLIRPTLPVIKNSPSGALQLFALTINGQFPLGKAHIAHFFMMALSASYLVIFVLLPKNGKIASDAVMKKSLPDLDELKDAIFFIETPLQNLAFLFWYRFLMRLTLLIVTILPCMLLNMFRSVA